MDDFPPDQGRSVYLSASPLIRSKPAGQSRVLTSRRALGKRGAEEQAPSWRTEEEVAVGKLEKPGPKNDQEKEKAWSLNGQTSQPLALCLSAPLFFLLRRSLQLLIIQTTSSKRSTLPKK